MSNVLVVLLARRRGRVEIMMAILDQALTGANKTKIMYRANLNFSRFERYFRELSKKGLVEVIDDPDASIVYRTTERGAELLRVLREAEKLLSL